MSDKTIIADILGGDTGLFSRLVERYLPLVRGVCTSHVHDPAAQDDLVQETFLAAYLGLNRLRHPERLGPWLARIARYKCLTWIRSQARHTKTRERLAQETAGATAPDPVQEATRREMCAWVRREIARLPVSSREAMVLFYLEGYTIAEAARLLGTREGAIKKRLQYGRQLVSEKMLNQFGERPARETTDRLKRRVLLALPLAKAPWKSASAQGAATASSFAGMMAIAKIAVLLILPVLGLGIALHHAVSQVEPGTVAESPTAGGGPVSQPTPLAAFPAVEEEGAALPAAETGELALRLRYRMRPTGLAMIASPSGNADPEPTVRPGGEGLPVPGARVHLKPLRPNQQVRKMLFEETDLDPRLAELLDKRASLRGAEDWQRHFKEQGITEAILAREKAKLLKLRDKYGEKGLESLFEQLVGPGPAREWISGTSAGDGTLVFTKLAPGAYRVEVTLEAAEPRATPEPTPPQTDGTESAPATVESAAQTAAATTTITIHEGKRVTRTIHVNDPVSQIKGIVVNGETGDPVGLIELFASGEALCGEKQRIWVKSDGTFSLPLTVTGFGDFTIEGKPRGFIPITLRGSRQPGEPTHVAIALDCRPTISGFVRSSDGTPVTGVSIMRRDVDGSGATGTSGTDEDGFFSVSHDGGIITLYASGNLSQSEEQTFELEADESIVHDFTMPATGTAIIHLRTDTGEVPENIDLSALRTENASLSGTILRRQDDHFIIPYLKPARYHLVLGVLGFETVARSFTIRDDLADTVLSFQLVRGRQSLAVQVVDFDGKPKGDADIRLMLVIRKVGEDGLTTGSSSSSIAHAKTDGEGLAVFEELATGEYRVHCENASQAVTLPHADTVIVTLEPPKVEPDVLYLDLDRARGYDALQDRLPLELNQDAIRVLAPSGKLTGRRLEVGENIIFAFKSGYPPAMTSVDVSAEMVQRKKAIHSNVYNKAVELVFGEGGAVHGVVQSAKGERAADQELCVFPAELWKLTQSGPDRYRWHSLGRAFAGGARSAADGSFQIRFLPPGTYVVSLRNQGAVSEPFEIIAGHEVGPVVLVR